MFSAAMVVTMVMLWSFMPSSAPRGRFRVVQMAPAAIPGVPTDVQRLEYESAADGARDWALAARPQECEPTWVVYLHGHGAAGDQLFTRPDIRDLWLPEIRRRGFGILSPNLRGAAWMSPSAARDLRALLAWARRECGARRFVLLGGSMGGSSVLAYAAMHPSDVAAAIALCPAADIGAYAVWCTSSETPICREIGQAIVSAYGGSPSERRAVYDAHSAVRHARRLLMPVYVCHGALDGIIPPQWTRLLARALEGRTNFRYEEQPDGDHETPLGAMPRALEWVLDQMKGNGVRGSEHERCEPGA